MTFTTTPPAARPPRAVTTPAAAATHANSRRGQDHDWSAGAWKHPAKPADKYEGCYLARKGMAWLVCATTWMLAALLVAFLAGGGAHKAVSNVAHAFQAERLNH